MNTETDFDRVMAPYVAEKRRQLEERHRQLEERHRELEERHRQLELQSEELVRMHDAIRRLLADDIDNQAKLERIAAVVKPCQRSGQGAPTK